MALSDQSEPDVSDLKLMLYRNNLKQALLSACGLIKPNTTSDSSKFEQTEYKVVTVTEECTNENKSNEDATADQENKSSSSRGENVEMKESLVKNEGNVHITRKRRRQRTSAARHLVFETTGIESQEENEKFHIDSNQTKKSEIMPQLVAIDLLDKYQKNDQQFACLYCYKTFRSRISLKVHMEAHSRDTLTRSTRSFALLDKSSYKKKLFVNANSEKPKTLKCNFCKKFFKNHSQLSRHKATQHRKDRLPKKEFSCKKCGKVFTTQHRFSVHLMEHGLKFKCGICDMRFKHPKELFYHKSTHVNDVIQCNICKEAFGSKLKLAKHLEVHNEKRKKLKCKFCKRSFKLTKDFAHHEVVCSNQKCFECAVCGENFVSKIELSTHLEHHMQNEDGKKEFKCEICNRTFKFIKHFARHKKWSNCQNVTPEKELAAYDSCDKPRALQNSLHCKEEPINSDINEFKQEDIYVTEKLIDCELDELLTPLKANLGENLLKIEDNGGAAGLHALGIQPNCDGNETTYESSDFLCCVCDEIFVSKEHLYKHQEEHNDVQFQCTECSAVFSTDSRRYKHLYQAHYTII